VRDHRDEYFVEGFFPAFLNMAVYYKCHIKFDFGLSGNPGNQGEKMAYTLDTTVGEILKDTHAVEILERHVPGVSKNPMIGMAKGMTLKTLLAMPQAKQAGITEDMVKKVLAEINARK
jgi:hypothetical protein